MKIWSSKNIRLSPELLKFVQHCFETSENNRMEIVDVMEWCGDDHPVFLAECEKLRNEYGDFYIDIKDVINATGTV